jgi:hypothetical protein
VATFGVAMGVLSEVLARPLSLADGECERDGGDCVDSSFTVGVGLMGVVWCGRGRSKMD